MRTRPWPSKKQARGRAALALSVFLAGAPCLLAGVPCLAAGAAVGRKEAAAPDCAAPQPARGRTAAAPGRGVVRAVDARLELLLEDGRVVKIAGLDPPRPTPDAPELDEEAAREAGERLVGREIVLAPLYTAPDRWGRVVAEVFAPAPGGAATASIAGGLLRAGLGRVEAGAAARRCRAYLLGEEAAARAARLGVWADPYYAVLRPADRAGFAERAGTLAIVEGEVVGIEVSDFRTTLTFGERRGQAFSIVVAARNLKRFSAAGVDLAALRGKIVRARGLVDLRFGPQIEIEEPGEIEASAPGAADGRADAR